MVACFPVRADGTFTRVERSGKMPGSLSVAATGPSSLLQNAYLAVAFGEFAGEFLPILAGHLRLLAVSALASLALLNWLGLKAGSRAQEITSLGKALGLIALVIAAFTVSAKAGTASFRPSNSFVHPHSLFLGLILELQAVVVTYDGWYAPIYFVEEDKDPRRTCPAL